MSLFSPHEIHETQPLLASKSIAEHVLKVETLATRPSTYCEPLEKPKYEQEEVDMRHLRLSECQDLDDVLIEELEMLEAALGRVESFG